MQAATPQILGPYRLLESLGQGGMGVVWRALDQRSGQMVALKTVKVPRATLLAGIRREIYALAQLRHPGIIRILDDGVEQGLPWYAMELLQGMPLDELVLGREKQEARQSAATGWWTSHLGETLAISSAPALETGAPDDGSSRTGPSDWSSILGLPDWSSVGGGTLDAAALDPARLAPNTVDLGSSSSPASALLASLPRVLSVLRKVCKTLAYLHGEGIVHRDLKPANILLRSETREERSEESKATRTERRADSGIPATDPTPSSLTSHSSLLTPCPGSPSSLTSHSSLLTPGPGSPSSLTSHSSLLTPSPLLTPVLVDFGLVSQFGGSGREILQEAGRLSGTVAYMAPEQILGEHVDARADLYALGCLLYHLVTGRPPFVGSTQDQVLWSHLRAQPVPPSVRVPGLPAKLDTLILELLAKRPEERIGHAETVAAALAELGAEPGDPVEAQPSRAYLYRPRFTGRAKLLQTFEASLGQLDGGPGGMLLLGGESGTGKTRLAMELARLAIIRGIAVLLGQCEPVDLTGSKASGRLLMPLRRPLQAVADRCRERGEAETRRLLGDHGPLLGLYEPALLDLPGQQSLPMPAALPPQAAQERLFRALAETLQALADKQPVLLILDDLQWADELTLGLLEFLSSPERRTPYQFLILGTYRNEEVGDSLGALLAVQPQPTLLKRFDAEEVGAMVRSMLALPQTPEVFVQFLTRQSEGNPFFVAEVLRSAVEQDLLYRDKAGRWQVARPGDEDATEQTYAALPLPRSLLDLVGARLSRLSVQAQQLVEALSVLGREADADLASQLSGLRGSAAMDATLEAISRQVLEPAEGERLRFVHDKLREVAYSRLDSARRLRLHRAAAEALELTPAQHKAELLGELGRHWEQAGEPERAQPRYLAAARRAVAAYGLQEAEAHYRAYLRLVRTVTAESVTARHELGQDVLEMRGRSEDALQEATRAVEETRALGDRRLEGEGLHRLGWRHQRLGKRETALHLFQQSLAIHRELGHRLGEGVVLGSLAILYGDLGQPEQARLLYEQSLAIHRAMGDRPSEGRALGNLSNLLRDLGQTEQALLLGQQALSIYREQGDRHSEGRSLSNLGILHQLLGDLPQARQLWEQSLAIHREVGNRRSEAIVLGNLGLLASELEPPDQSQRLFEQALAIQREVGNRRQASMLLLDLAGMALLAWGNLPRAAELVEEARQLLSPTQDHLGVAGLLVCQGHITLASGRSCRDEFQRAEALASSLQAGPDSPLGRGLGRLQRAVEAFEAGLHHKLFRGRLREDIPQGLHRWLRETGHLPG